MLNFHQASITAIKPFGFLLLSLIFTFAGFGAQRPFKELTINNGLPHTDAHYAVQDAKGFLWFATLDGLCRYDGGEMIVYRNIHSDLNSISNNRINCLQYDHTRKGLWVGTQGGGLNFLNLETGKFVRLTIKDSNGENLTEIISIQKLKSGAVWAGTIKGITQEMALQIYFPTGFLYCTRTRKGIYGLGLLAGD
ncbi:MAG TPA: hypothetical protein VNI52_11200 [Sphingobacteriaceae bacterium]|nr:hypothetical protein [Sphingobacteriaceae bacterium]